MWFDTLNDNGEQLLAFATNHSLALVNTFFSTPKNCVSHTFNGRGKKRIDYILTRQRDRKLLRDVVVYPQVLLKPISDHNIVAARVKLLGRFTHTQHPSEELKKAAYRSATADDRSSTPRRSGESDGGAFEGEPPKR